jgi:hypothetical protein
LCHAITTKAGKASGGGVAGARGVLERAGGDHSAILPAPEAKDARRSGAGTYIYENKIQNMCK